jgi:hypothetical protein
MLFDLKGKRRRAVQVTYLGLAILIGLGLIGFGVGSSVNGGLSDIFSGGGGGSNTANKTLQKQIDAANRRLALNPRDTAALRTLILRHYQIAGSTENTQTNTFTSAGKQELRKASAAWDRYVALVPKPDPALASAMLQAYDTTALNVPVKAMKAAEILAAAQPSVQAYERIIGYATLAHDTRTADLATSKALDLTPAGQRATVKKQITQLKAQAAAMAGQAGGPSGGP